MTSGSCMHKRVPLNKSFTKVYFLAAMLRGGEGAFPVASSH